jgi:uncharacterized membrane protein YfcA
MLNVLACDLPCRICRSPSASFAAKAASFNQPLRPGVARGMCDPESDGMILDPVYLPLLVATGFIAGAMNAAAGGGSFVTLPVLVFAGLPALAANVSSTVALWPGALTSAIAYRNDFKPFGRVSLRLLFIVSVIGGGIGALLLLYTPVKAFDVVVPWLLLAATLAFVFGREAGLALRRVVRIGPGAVLAVQFMLGVYGGYFGGAVGIVMMAVWGLMSEADLKIMGPTRTVVVAGANTMAVALFLFSGQIWWAETAAMLAGAAFGGYAGARSARLLDPQHLRLGVIVLSVVMTAAFFARRYL